MTIFKKKLRAFTLIEILVVIAIIGILAAIGLGSYGSAQSKARDARRKSDLGNIARALEMYRGDTGDYPDYSPVHNLCMPDCLIRVLSGASYVDAPWGGPFVENGETYMQKLPEDPRLSDYNYVRWESGVGVSYKAYWLFARLENLEDGSPNFARTPAGEPSTWNFGFTNWSPQCGGEGCNYYISSPNAPTPAPNAVTP